MRVARAGEAHSRLDGIPISVKDNLHVAGFPTTWGSRALQDFRPAKDELPVARLSARGHDRHWQDKRAGIHARGLYAQ